MKKLENIHLLVMLILLVAVGQMAQGEVDVTWCVDLEAAGALVGTERARLMRPRWVLQPHSADTGLTAPLTCLHTECGKIYRN